MIIGIIFLIVIIGSWIFFYMSTSSNGSKTSKTKVALKFMYPKLIEMLHAGSNPKEFISTVETYQFGWITPGADNRFTIKQNTGTITIKWKFKGKLVWENKTVVLDEVWTFVEHEDEEQMARKVLIEMTEKFNKSELGQY